MNAVASMAAAFGAAFSGFTALSLAMDRHFEDSFGRGRTPGRWLPWLRVGGVVGLGVSLWVCLALQGPTQGWVLWLGLLTAAAAVLVVVLSYVPRWSLAICLLGLATCTLSLTMV